MADIKLKERIAKRVAKEMHDGDVVNLGIGLPTMVPNYIPEDVIVTLHSENGFAGLDETVSDPSKIDVDIIDSGGSYVTVLPRVKYFDIGQLRDHSRRTSGRYCSGCDAGCRERRSGELDHSGPQSCRHGRCHGPGGRCEKGYHRDDSHPEGQPENHGEVHTASDRREVR